MGRQVTVGDGKGRHGGEADVDGWQTELRGHAEDDRHEQHEADGEEQRHANDEPGEQQRPLHVAVACPCHEARGDALRGPALGHDLPEHRAEPDDENQRSQRVAQPALHGCRHLTRREPERQAKADRDDEE
jgi:hypothetical protein